MTRHDVFISYCRADGTPYGTKLAEGLDKLGFKCFFDQWEAQPGTSLPSELCAALRRSSLLVLIGTSGACESRHVAEELALFDANSTKRPIIPVEFGIDLIQTQLGPCIGGLARYRETDTTDAPSRGLFARIESSFKPIRWRRRILIASGTTFIVVAIAIAGLVALGWQLKASKMAEQQKLELAERERARGAISEARRQSDLGNDSTAVRLALSALPSDFSRVPEQDAEATLYHALHGRALERVISVPDEQVTLLVASPLDKYVAYVGHPSKTQKDRADLVVMDVGGGHEVLRSPGENIQPFRFVGERLLLAKTKGEDYRTLLFDLTKGGNDPICGVAGEPFELSSNDHFLIVYDRGDVRSWDLLCGSSPKHRGEGWPTMSANRQYLAIASPHGVAMWDTETGRAARIPSPAGTVAWGDGHPSLAIREPKGKHISIWEWRSRLEKLRNLSVTLTRCSAGGEPIADFGIDRYMQFADKDRRLVFGRGESAAEFWKIDSLASVPSASIANDCRNVPRQLANGRLLITQSEDLQETLLWKLPTGGVPSPLTTFPGRYVASDPQGRFVVTEQKIDDVWRRQVFRTSTSRTIVLPNNGDRVDVAFVSDGSAFFAAAPRAIYRFQDGIERVSRLSRDLQRLGITGVDPAYSPDGKYLATTTNYLRGPAAGPPRVMVWRTNPVGDAQAPIELRSERLTTPCEATFAPDSNTLAVMNRGTNETFVFHVDAPASSPQVLSGVLGEYSSDGQSLVTTTGDKALIYHVYPEGLRKLIELDGYDPVLALSEGGLHVATYVKPNTTNVYRLNGNVSTHIATVSGQRPALATTAGLLATTEVSQSVSVYELEARPPRKRWTWLLEGKLVLSMRFSHHGDRLALGLSDHSARILDANTGALVAVLDGHNGAVTGIRWSADDGYVTTASENWLDETSAAFDDPLPIRHEWRLFPSTKALRTYAASLSLGR